jgi:hypothetical protein
MVEIKEYPFSVELPLSTGYNSIIDWLGSRAIKKYKQESFMRGKRPFIRYWFAQEADAVMFSLRWS